MRKPMKYVITMDLTTGAPTPKVLPCTAGDKIVWHNNFSATVDSFTLPDCVSPKTDPLPLEPGGDTIEYTVNKDMKGCFPYEYEFDDELCAEELKIIISMPQNGTIDPS